MIEFLQTYWQFISTILLIILSVVLSLFSKKKEVVIEDGLLARIYSDAIELINIAERTYVQGKDKLDFVVNTLVEKYPDYSKYLNQTFSFGSFNSSSAKDCFALLVEMILSTPHKKG